VHRDYHVDKADFAFKISLDAALQERGSETRPDVMAELEQMVNKRVWHGVLVSNLTLKECTAIIRS
jgi:hypothetical protein